MSLNPSDLINAIQIAFGNEWKRTKTSPLPDVGTEDRRLLFAAVAYGLLKFIDEHQDEVLTKITFKDEGQGQEVHTVVGTEFDIGGELKEFYEKAEEQKG